jgi:hypothetical protein
MQVVVRGNHNRADDPFRPVLTRSVGTTRVALRYFVIYIHKGCAIMFTFLVRDPIKRGQHRAKHGPRGQ